MVSAAFLVPVAGSNGCVICWVGLACGVSRPELGPLVRHEAVRRRELGGIFLNGYVARLPAITVKLIPGFELDYD